jgi:ribonuclease R
MEIKDRIINLVKDNNVLSFLEIKKQLNADEKELYTAIKELQNDYELWRTKNGKYMLFKDTNLAVGKLIVNAKGNGYLKTDDEVINIRSKALNGAIHGDVVLVEKYNKDDNEGQVREIINTNKKLLTGTVVYKNGRQYINVDQSNYRSIIIHVPKSARVNDNDKVLFKIGYEMGHNHYDADIQKVLGNANDPDIDMISIIERNEIPNTYSDEVLEEIKRIPTEVDSDLSNRVDLRDEMIITIDGDDAKDLDDAISIKMLDNGNFLLGVHIADVSHYVKEGSAIYNEAVKRGTSVYLVDRVIPMLPRELSNGICSLNEGVDRLTLSASMEIDPTGKVVNSDIYRSVINSSKRMTYKNVNKVLNDEDVPEDYKPFKKMLLQMYKLSLIIRNKRTKAGAIDFDRPEVKIIVDEKGEPIELKARERGIAENIIEDFMIEANKCVSTHAYNMYIPFIYRVHGYPEVDSLESAEKLVESLGYKLSESLVQDEIHPIYIQRALKELKDAKEYPIISDKFLRSMKKAEYSENPNGHFGLAILAQYHEFYSHFTSPIRRLPDMLIHRIIKDVIIDGKYDKEYFDDLDRKLPSLASQSSITERRAQSCEWEVEDLKICKYMKRYIGKSFEAMIMGFSNTGINLLIDGMIKVNIPSKNFKRYEISDERLDCSANNTNYHVGDIMEIKISDVSVDNRRIYATPVKQYDKVDNDEKVKQRKRIKEKGGKFCGNNK